MNEKVHYISRCPFETYHRKGNYTVGWEFGLPNSTRSPAGETRTYRLERALEEVVRLAVVHGAGCGGGAGNAGRGIPSLHLRTLLLESMTDVTHARYN